MSEFSMVLTPASVSFTAPDGRVHNVLKGEEEFDAVCAAIKELQVAKAAGEDISALHQSLADILTAKAATINAAGHGKVRVENGVVYYEEDAIHSALTDRIIWGLEEGFDMTPYIRFLENVMENPSSQAVKEMYTFMEAAKMGITDDGCILGYKKVTEDYKDIYSKTFDNSVGSVVEMRRNQVDDNREQTCSTGLHFCSMSYLPNFGTSRGNRVVIVKVHPRDIVSVPVDYQFAKARCCRYEVIAEYTGDDLEDLLGSKAVWTDNDWEDGENEDWNTEEEESIEIFELDSNEEE